MSSIRPLLPLLLTDFYKTGHHLQYPDHTEYIYSNFTPRTSRIEGIDHVVVFGIQYFIQKYLVDLFNDHFFNQPVDEVLREYKERMDTSFGPNNIGTDHIKALHEFGYLPLHIKSLEEGTLCPMRVPVLTIVNTHPNFYWLTNYIETLLSVVLWHPMTSATIAHEYKKILKKYAQKTSDNMDFVSFQAHDFSMRGQSSLESAMVSGAAHLTSFKGTDTIPAIDLVQNYYGSQEFIGGSIPATEHSVMCAGGENDEEGTYIRLLTKIYPDGLVSIVSDTWDYWNLITSTLLKLKSIILSRNGKLVIRPDSGDPVKIICGDPDAKSSSPQSLGTIEILWNIFGGTVNSKGYKELDPHIGCIYGDSITMDRCEEICSRLEKMGFASTNVVFGIGSFTYQYVTRDTFGFAMKSTYAIINGVGHEIFKKPKTDNGVKNSAKGLLRVNPDMTLSESVTGEESASGMLQTVFINGETMNRITFDQIRKKLE